jgi:hypothetical protein
MLKFPSALGSDRGTTDIILMGIIIRTDITDPTRIMATIGLTIGTAGTAITATIAIITTIGIS